MPPLYCVMLQDTLERKDYHNRAADAIRYRLGPVFERDTIGRKIAEMVAGQLSESDFLKLVAAKEGAAVVDNLWVLKMETLLVDRLDTSRHFQVVGRESDDLWAAAGRLGLEPISGKPKRGSLDLVILSYAIVETPSLKPFMKSVCASLKPNGLLVIRDHDCPNKFIQSVLDFDAAIIGALKGERGMSREGRHQSIASVEKELKGFQLCEIGGSPKGHPLREYMRIYQKL